MPAYDPAREELIYQHGDAPDPMGERGAGFQSTINLANGAAVGHPKIRYRDVVIEADVYQAGEDPSTLRVQIICPRCRHGLTIPAALKSIDWDPQGGAPQDGGQISVEKFKCTWETSAERQHFGLSLCNWSVAIDKNVARDA